MPDIIDVEHFKQVLQKFADERDWNQYHNPKNLSMAVEAGELIEIFQWLTDKDSVESAFNSSTKEKVSHELADILLYAIRIAAQMDINLNEALHTKFSLNETKYPADKVKGSSRKYDEY
jgi:dCTP diphosphatase